MRPDAGGGWTRPQRALHWWSFALVGAGFAIAWVMVALPLRELLAKFLLFQLHKTLGLTVLVLAAARLMIRARRLRPGWDEALPDWQRRAASGVHAGLYALLIAVPVLGYFTAATAPAQVPTLFLAVIPIPHLVGPDPAGYAVLRQVHRAAAILLVVLAAGHALAAMHHHARGRDTLRRMWSGISGAERDRASSRLREPRASGSAVDSLRDHAQQRSNP